MRKAAPDFQLCGKKIERTLYRLRRKYDPEVSVAEMLTYFLL